MALDDDIRFEEMANYPDWDETIDEQLIRERLDRKYTGSRGIIRLASIVYLAAMGAGCSSPMVDPPPGNGGNEHHPTANLTYSSSGNNSGMLVCVGEDDDGNLTSIKITGPGDVNETKTFSGMAKNSLDVPLSGLAEGVHTYQCETTDADGGQKGTDTETVTVNQLPVRHDPTAHLVYTESSATSGNLACTGKDTDGDLTRIQVTGPNGLNEVVTFAGTTERTLDVTLEDLQAGEHTYQCETTDADGGPTGTDTETVTVDQQTVNLVVHVLNMTRDDNPVVRGEGDIQYLVGDTVISSADSLAIEVEPGTYEIWADLDGYHEPVGILQEAGAPSLSQLEQRGINDASSPVEVNRDMILWIYKVNERDLGSYDMDDVADILDDRKNIPLGTTRFDTSSLEVWVNTSDSNSEPTQEMHDALYNWAQGSDGATVHALTERFDDVTIREGGERPRESYIEVKYDSTLGGNGELDGVHGERFEDPSNPNRITSAFVILNPNRADRGVVLEEMAQSLGIRGDLTNRLEKDITNQTPDGQAIDYNVFGRFLGKFLDFLKPRTYLQN